MAPLFPLYPVLIIDDDRITLDGYRITLNEFGINNFSLCNDSREVMPLLLQNTFSLILLDLRMPYISGQELLEKIKIDVFDKLETIYLESIEFSFKEVDNFLKPYMKSLYDKGWKVIEHLVEKSQITYDFEAYDITLLVPEAKFVKDAGFMVFKYNRDVDNDTNTLNYMFDILSRKGKEEVLNKGIGVVDVKLIENEIDINGKKFKGHLPEFKFEHSNEYIQLTETVMIPIKNKIFFLWAENHKYILDMAETIFKIDIYP